MAALQEWKGVAARQAARADEAQRKVEADSRGNVAALPTKSMWPESQAAQNCSGSRG
jgi:hypothetical protein